MTHEPTEAAEHANPEYIAGWWDVTLDASVWWRAESVSPIHAAMLLWGANPNTDEAQNLERSSNEELGPEDFRRLRNLFGAADGGRRRTLDEWADCAREAGARTHSWFEKWQAAKRQIDPGFFAGRLSTRTEKVAPNTPAKPRTANAPEEAKQINEALLRECEEWCAAQPGRTIEQFKAMKSRETGLSVHEFKRRLQSARNERKKVRVPNMLDQMRRLARKE